MAKRSRAWKQLEKDTAEELGGYRIARTDYGYSTYDGEIPDFPFFKLDTKRRKKAAIYPLYEEVKEKYCKKPTDSPVLVVRQHGKHTKLAVIDLRLLQKFMDFVRRYNGQKEFECDLTTTRTLPTDSSQSAQEDS